MLERFAYYGIYFSFGIYLTQLGYSRNELGIIQPLFLLLSFVLPLFSGTLADKYGFKKLLIAGLRRFPHRPAKHQCAPDRQTRNMFPENGRTLCPRNSWLTGTSSHLRI